MYTPRRRLYLILSLVAVWSLALGWSVDMVRAGVPCTLDSDKDGVCDEEDNCPKVYNPKQDDVCPKPPITADCSPGYYKNHVDIWDNGICCTGDARDPRTACGVLYLKLCAQCGATASERATAKAFLDACFETAEESPCEDDD